MNPSASFDFERDYSIEELLQSVIAIKELPNQLAKVITGLTDEDASKQYREGSWTVRQIIHHLADSHMNAFIRTKHLLAQDADSFQPYDQDIWNDLMDKDFNHEASFMILLGIHQRWSLTLLECLKQPEKYLALSAYHPEHKKNISLAQLIAMYGWHGLHHVLQIQEALKK
jgi:hypothetical protein